uniref:Glycosyltransferase n=1 Tax=viral metagenome TaxID=1070528 RepID=A0A6M3L1A9_9ZZZZ
MSINAQEIKGLKIYRGNATRRIFIAVGLTGLLRAEWVQARYCGQIIPSNWSQVQYTQFIDQMAPMGYGVSDFRNIAVKEFLAKDFEWLIFIDHDVVLPPDFTIKVNERIIKEKVPVWSGLYFTRSVPAEPIVYKDRGNGYAGDWRIGDKVWTQAVPMGCTVIHNSILKTAWNETEEYKIGPDFGHRIFQNPDKGWIDPISRTWMVKSGTEDLDFCWRVIDNQWFKKSGWPEYQKKKYPFLIDTSIFCGHINPDGKIFPSGGEEQYFMRK